MKTEIKKTESSEFERLAEIYFLEFSKPPYNENWTKEKAIEKLKILSKYCEIYSIFYQDQLVGFFAANPNKFLPGTVIEGEEFVVDFNFQNLGIGTFVLDWACKEYSKRGYIRFILLSSRNSKQFNFYTKRNYLESETDVLLERCLK